MWVDNLIACEVLLTMMLNHAWLTPQELEELENVNHKVIHIKIGLKLTNLFNLQDVTPNLNTHPVIVIVIDIVLLQCLSCSFGKN